MSMIPSLLFKIEKFNESKFFEKSFTFVIAALPHLWPSFHELKNMIIKSSIMTYSNYKQLYASLFSTFYLHSLALLSVPPAK